MKARAWEPPFKVVADHRTSCAFLVYNQSGSFFPDESIEAMDATAKFIEDACNRPAVDVDKLAEEVVNSMLPFMSPNRFMDLEGKRHDSVVFQASEALEIIKTALLKARGEV